MDDVGEWVTDVLTTFSFLLSLGRLRNHDDDDDGIEILKKSKGLVRKTTTVPVRHTCCYISLRSLHDRDIRFPNFCRTETQVDDFLFLFKLGYGPRKFSSRKICLPLTS